MNRRFFLYKKATKIFLVIILAGINAWSCSLSPKTRDVGGLEMLLQDAYINYWTGEFDRAVLKINQYFVACKRLRKRPSSRAFVILPQIYLSKNDFVRAHKAVKLLLTLKPNFNPAPNEYPSDFVAVIAKVKSDMQARQKIADKASPNTKN